VTTTTTTTTTTQLLGKIRHLHMGKTTDRRQQIDVVPNGVAFNLAKSWLGLVKKDDDGNAGSSRKNNDINNNNDTFSLEAFRRESQREEEETSTSGRHGKGGSQQTNRLGLGAKYLSHSKAARTMQTIAEKKIFDRIQREKITKRMEEKEREGESESSSSSDEDEEDVRGLSKSKKRKMERFDASTYRRK